MDDFCTTIQGPPEDGWPMPASSMTNPVHWGPVTDSVRIVLEEVGLDQLRPGDVVVCNDSYRTGKHLNDMSFIRPLFHGERIVGALHVTAHQLDVGSRIPGGFDALSGSLWEDGLVLTPMHLYREGRPVRATYDLIAANTRYPEIILADLEVIRSTLDLGEELLQQSIERYGLDAYLGAVRYACDVAAEEMGRAIAALPDGTYTSAVELAPDAATGATNVVALTLRKSRSRLEFDFSGTSAQSPSSMNCSWLDPKTGVIVALKLLFDRRSAPSSGSLRDVDLVLPPGSMVNPTPPTATMSYYAMVDVVIRATVEALNEALGLDAIAFDTAMSGSGHRAAGVTAEGVPWYTTAVTNVPSYPKGATAAGDADSYGLVTWMNAANLSTEVLELANPVLLLEAEAVADTSGAGYNRGGSSMLVTTQYRHAGNHTWGVGQLPRGAAGVCGGRDGGKGAHDWFGPEPGASLALGAVPPREAVGADVPPESFDAGVGSTFRQVMPSGGGWGDPLDREPERVVVDVRDGYVTVEGAARDYGVVVVGDPELAPEELSFDPVATAELRQRLGSG
jgi:N-methylhydantoinase B